MNQAESVKQCSRCKEIKLVTNFHIIKSKNKYRSECKLCHSLQMKLYIKNLSPERRVKLRIQQNTRRNARKQEDPSYRKSVNDYNVAINNKRYKNDPKYREGCYIRAKKSKRKRRAISFAVNEHYCEEDEIYTKQLFQNCCVNCGANTKIQIDHHFPLSLGNPLTRSNAVLLCESCNKSKGKKMPKDFYDITTLHKIESLLNIESINISSNSKS